MSVRFDPKLPLAAYSHSHVYSAMPLLSQDMREPYILDVILHDGAGKKAWTGS